MPIEMSLTDLSLIALAKAASEPIPLAGPQAEAVSYAVYCLPHEIRQQLVLGHFGRFRNTFLQRHPVFDAEFGVAARTIQRFYRGSRTRRYLELAQSPKKRFNRRNERDVGFSMKPVFEIAPPKAFVRNALRDRNNPGRCREKLLATQKAWASFLEHEATDEERAAFARFSQQLVIVPLDQVRTIEQQLVNLSASTLAGIPATGRFLKQKANELEQREVIQGRCAAATVLPALCLTVPRSLPLFKAGVKDMTFAACAWVGGALLSNVPFLWPAALLPLTAGMLAWALGSALTMAGAVTSVAPVAVAGSIASTVSGSVVTGANALLPSEARGAYHAQRRQLEAQLARLQELCEEAPST